MRLLFVIRSLACAHGVERTLIDKVNYLADQGHEVTMVTYEQGTHQYAFFVNPRVDCIDLDCRYFKLYDLSVLQRQYLGFKMKRRFRDRLHTIVEAKRPDVVITPTYTVEYMKAVMSLKSMTRVILEAHSAFLYEMKGGGWKRRYRKRLLLQTMKRCDLLIALTQQDAQYWREYIRNVAVVVNPVSDYPEVIDDEPKIAGRIVAVGRLQSQKRFDRLIDAFSLIADKYPGWFIDIYGEGNERQMLEDLIKSHGLVGRVHLKGESSNVFTEYKRSQFFAFSSDTEGFGLVLIEAMACGIPAVSVNCPFGPSEIIEDGVTGLLTKMNANDLAAKMEWMITHEAERQEMGARARKAAARYQIQVVMKDWEKAYASELNT